MVAVIRHRHRFGETFGFIINAARPDGVNIAPVIFFLRVHQRIAVALRCRREDERRLFVFGQSERVVRPKCADLQRRNRQLQIINRACRRREMKHVVDLFVGQENEIGNVVLDEMEILVAGKMPDVCSVAGDEIVDRNDAVTFGEKSVDQMRSQETCATGNNRNGFGFFLGHSTGYLIPKQ